VRFLTVSEASPNFLPVNPATFYDNYWESDYHRGYEWPDRWMRQIEPLFGCERVLDYGCGMGDTYQRRLAASVKHYVAADVSSMALSTARKRGFETLVIDPQTSRTEAPDASFDGALSVEVLEHLFDPLAAARELFRVIKPGGRVIVTVPNFGYHECRLLALLRAQVPSEPEQPRINRFNGVHIRYFSKLMLTRLLRDAGFGEIHVTGFADSSIWDIFRAAGPFGHVSHAARNRLPGFLHLRFMEVVWPNVFAKHLRATARKAA
jgi:2-polyprenyl-3-methyl-5-hydroxy-6-metoxy-1,4-benzoquinol methylase